MSDYEVLTGGVNGLVKAFTKGVAFEDEAKKQVVAVSRMPFIHKHVAVMPDVHAGKGATVGSVIATLGAVIPAAVGVDIGCGMIAVKTDLKQEDLPNLAKLRASIEEAIPHGGGGAVGAFKDAKPVEELDKEYRALVIGTDGAVASKYVWDQFGTLGGGNHFVEVCIGEDGFVWIMLHSGSRGVGNRIGSYFIGKAQEKMEEWFIKLEDKDLAYLPESDQLYVDYVRAVNWAQKYALMSREKMMLAACIALSEESGKAFTRELEVNCHHNYISRENHFGRNAWVTRKGAVRARKGDYGIIPGSMGAKSFIVKGLGNPDSFDSCSHGAGRVMSRAEAKRRFTAEDHARATEGIECRKDSGVVDETPGAYKNIDDVMKAQSSLVEIVHTLKQVLCIKG